MAETPSPIWRNTLGRRLPVAAALLGLWAVGIEARLVHLQLVRHDELVARATRQQSKTVPVPASRGEIRDRNGRLLAVSVDAPSITMDPSEVENPTATIDAICRVLGDCTKEERAAFLRRAATGKEYAPVRKWIEPEQRERIAELKLPGIAFVTEPRRLHPNGELAAHVLGYISADANLGPVSGIELSYRSRLEGSAGKVTISKDAKRKVVLDERIETPPTAGASLELTVDAQIQSIVERELSRGVEENHAESGSVIVMDPWSGDLLAVANFPTFNPDSLRGVSPLLLRNRAVEDLIEPGSTFKVVTASAALEQHVVTPDEIIDLNHGRIQFGSDDVVNDTHPHSQLSFTEVIVQSSNVGAIKVGQRLGKERLTDYVKRFGFGARTGAGFPFESKGMITEAAQLTERTLARVSMGYTVGVTPLQLAAAVSSIANGGELLQPHVVRRIVKGRQSETVPRIVVRRTVPTAVTTELTRIMEGVVERGTATSAQIAGFSIAGKTGTASRLVGGRYSKTEYNASFVGFVPSRKPVYTIVVVINSPHGKNGYYGGVVSAPVFRRIAEQLVVYGGVQRTLDPPPPVLVTRQPAGGREIPASNRSGAAVVTAPTVDSGLVPDLTGLNARDAMRMMARLGVVPRLRGATGLVVDQRPVAGTRLEPGLKATLWLGREHPVPRKVDTATQ